MKNISIIVINKEIWILKNVNELAMYESTRSEMMYVIIIRKNNMSHLERT